jgi:hypothetical protein
VGAVAAELKVVIASSPDILDLELCGARRRRREREEGGGVRGREGKEGGGVKKKGREKRGHRRGGF